MLLIDPYNLRDFPRTTEGFENLVLYSIAAAGHGAWVMARNLELFNSLAKGKTPFEKVRKLHRKGELGRFMQHCGFGTPFQFAEGWYDATEKLSLPDDLTVAKLTTVKRIGPKTARLIIHNAFPNWQDRAEEDRRELAILDRLILRWIRSKGYWKAPKDTPQSVKAYDKWEQVWVKLKAKYASDDLDLWNGLTKPPPSDWKTRPIKRRVGGGAWYVLGGKAVLAA